MLPGNLPTGVRGRWLVPGGMWLMTISVPQSILGCGFSVCAALAACIGVRVGVCACVCVYSFSQPTNYCPEEPAAAATIVFSSTAITLPPPPSSLLYVDRGRVRRESQPQVLLPWGVITPPWDTVTHINEPSNTQLLSLSICLPATTPFN